MKTHHVFNQFFELNNYNLFTTDQILQTAFLGKEDVCWKHELEKIGMLVGTENSYLKAQEANSFLPQLKAFDARGNRKDEVVFHPSWHYFMALSKTNGYISTPFESEAQGRWRFAAAAFILQSQVEAGAMCPATMTLACIPVLQKEEKLWNEIGEKLLSREYDERDIPIHEKKSIWIGMGMTEKQGGSDVRSNTTFAQPIEKSGRGEAYLIRGHKWFFSAPMSDAHLVIAKIKDTETIGCFFVPRWKPDGTKNEVQIQRLKDKVGNKSNSSSEVEFFDAYGILIGEETRGIPTIIEMATLTRLCCVLGSTGMMRQSLVQAIAYTQQRKAFGKTLFEQALMRSVLTDIALESEAATHLSMFLADAFENASQENLLALAWKRIITPAAKYWVCKRAIEVSAECMEIFGGNGYVEDSVMARIFKEAPVNSIWEGSGNVMCLDVLRAFHKEPQLIDVLIQDWLAKTQNHPVLHQQIIVFVENVKQKGNNLEKSGRWITEQLILLAQAVILIQKAPEFVSSAFIENRLLRHQGQTLGTLQVTEAVENQILARAF